MLFLFSKRILFCLCYFSFSGISFSQKFTLPYSPSFPFRHIEYYGTEQGLNGSEVYRITQDENGFLWFLTDNALNRFDGYSFRTYPFKPGETYTVDNYRYSELIADNNKALWIGSRRGGFYSFDILKEKFSNFPYTADEDPNYLSNRTINSIVAKEDGNIWCAFKNSIGKYEPGTNRFTPFVPKDKDPTSLNGGIIYGMNIDTQNKADGIKDNLWIINNSAAIELFNTKTGKVLKRFPVPYSHYSDPYWSPLKTSGVRNGMIWFGSNDKKIYGFNVIKEEYVEIAMNRKCKNDVHLEALYMVTEDHAGNLWTTNDDNEIVFYDRREGRFYFYKVKKDNIKFQHHSPVIYEDRSNKIWITTNNGLIAIDIEVKKFHWLRHNDNDPHSLSSDLIYSVYKDKGGRIYIVNGSTTDVLNRKTNTITRLKFYENGRELNMFATWVIYEDSRGSVWFTSGVEGLISYNPETGSYRIHHLYDNSVGQLPDDYVGMIEDRKGRYWAVNWEKGLCLFDPATDKARVYQFRSPDDSTKTYNWGMVFQDSKNILYTTAWRGGMIAFDPEKGTHKIYRHDDQNPRSVSQDSPWPMIEKNGLLWIATFGGGINVFNPATEEFKAFTTDDGLPDNFIGRLIEDKRGNFWVSSGGGISCFKPPDDPFAPNCKINIRNYDMSDGLPSNIINASAGYYDSDGILYYGTRGGGLFYFHPDSLIDNPYIPPVHITELYLDNKLVSIKDSNSILKVPIEFTKEIKLNYKQNTVSFSFAALNYIHSEKNQYAYMLEGYDKDWIYTSSSKRFVNYTNLKPDTYIFKVKASNNDRIWNEAQAELKVIITPPFWQTAWFKILVIVAIAGAVYSVYRYRLGQVLKIQRIRNRIAADLHDDIGSTLNSISVFSEVAKNDPSKKDESLDMIGDSSRKVTDAMSDIVWTINPDNDSFDKMILRMRSLAYTLLRAKDIEFTFRADEELNSLKIPMEKRKNFFLIFKEILNNLIKHSQASGVSFSITKSDSKHVVLSAHDNGIGFDPAKTYGGNGLNNIRTRAKEIGAKLIIESGNGNGTTIQLIMKP